MEKQNVQTYTAVEQKQHPEKIKPLLERNCENGKDNEVSQGDGDV